MKEVHYGIYSSAQVEQLIEEKKVVFFKAKRPIILGNDCLLKVNMNIGVSDELNYDLELKKLADISKLPFRPDSMMDHTIVPLDKPLWKSMIETFDGAVGTLPHYLPYQDNSGINENDLFDNILDMARGGVSFMTLHPTAHLSLYNEAIEKGRVVPTTSRGGYVLLKDQAINARQENIISNNFEKIMKIFKEYGVGVSIGTVFRPATIYEALDDIHRKEIELQKYYIDIAKKHNVPVIMEGIGHISFDKIEEYAELIRGYNAPLMPLGPMPSDEIIGFDHISNALGALSIAQTGVVGMINSVTREEHTGKVPSFDSILEGLKTARATAHCYNISNFEQYKKCTEVIGLTRAKSESCVQKGGIFAFELLDESEASECTRCRRECPLKKIIV